MMPPAICITAMTLEAAPSASIPPHNKLLLVAVMAQRNNFRYGNGQYFGSRKSA